MDWKALNKNAALYLPMPALLKAHRSLLKSLDKIPQKVKTPVNFLFVGCFCAPTILAPLTKQPRLKGRWAKMRKIIGLPLLISGPALMAHSSAERNRVVGPDIPEKVITEGLYKRMRHPTYAGAMLACMGWSILMNAPYSAAVLPLGIVTIQKVAHNEEAEQMVPLFGEEYEEYRKSTPLFSKPVIFLLVAAYVYVLIGLRSAG